MAEHEDRRLHDAHASPVHGQVAAPFRILHLSDIHFGAHFDEAVWDYVAALARRERPQLIVCTGDLVDHGGLFMMAAAWRQLDELRRSIGDQVQLRCVPGNHDCGPFGNLRLRPFSTNFAALFGPQAMEVPSAMPSYLQHRRRAWPLRWLQRLALTPWLYARKWRTAIARWRQGQSLRSLPLLRGDDPQAVVLIYLDSNHGQWLATGNVDPQQVTRLKAQVLNLRDAAGARPFVPRIALLHHHPLPIPETSITEGLTSFEPFLVLRNAGQVMRELNRCDVDLVLHGHKHYAAFGRLGYSVDHELEGEIAVLAAGSSGVTLSEPGRNSVNLIDVFETGRMSYTPVHFGGGGGAPVHLLLDGRREVHGLRMHKARVHRRAAERQGQWVARVTHAVAVDAGGVAVVRHEVSGHAFERAQRSDLIPVAIDVSMGRVTHTTLELSEGSKRAGHRWERRPTAPRRSIRCGVRLGQRLQSAPPASYGWQYLCFNTYAVTEWETVTAVERDQRLGAHRGRVPGLEVSSFVVRVPVRTLVLRLQLPASLGPVEPFAQVMRWSGYPDIPLDDASQFHNDGPGEWVHDSDLTRHEAGALVAIGSGAWELRVDYPLVGHRYDVRWRVAPQPPWVAPGHEDPARRGRAIAYRRALLELAAWPGLQDGLQGWAAAMRNELLLPYFGAHLPLPGDLELALFVYDSDQQALRQVLAWPAAGLLPARPLVVPLGEGVVGAAFKRSDFVIYVDPALSGNAEDAAYLYQSGQEDQWAEPDWKVVWAFPIFALEHPLVDLQGLSFDDWGPQETVGVLTIASRASDSGLVRLADEAAADPEAPAPGTAWNAGTAGVATRPQAEAEAAPQAEVEAPPQAQAEASPQANPEAAPGAAADPPQADTLAPTARQIWGGAHLLLAFVKDAADEREAQLPQLLD